MNKHVVHPEVAKELLKAWADRDPLRPNRWMWWGAKPVESRYSVGNNIPINQNFPKHLEGKIGTKMQADAGEPAVLIGVMRRGALWHWKIPTTFYHEFLENQKNLKWKKKQVFWEVSNGTA